VIAAHAAQFEGRATGGTAPADFPRMLAERLRAQPLSPAPAAGSPTPVHAQPLPAGGNGSPQAAPGPVAEPGAAPPVAPADAAALAGAPALLGQPPAPIPTGGAPEAAAAGGADTHTASSQRQALAAFMQTPAPLHQGAAGRPASDTATGAAGPPSPSYAPAALHTPPAQARPPQLPVSASPPSTGARGEVAPPPFAAAAPEQLFAGMLAAQAPADREAPPEPAPAAAQSTGSAAAPGAQGSPVASVLPPAQAELARMQATLLHVREPVGQDAWKEAVGQRVTWMVEQQVSRAELRLHPAHLGPVDVSVRVNNDEVSVSFHATHPATREALEGSLPRLRELLADSGLSLGQASVSQQFAGGQRGAERAIAPTDARAAHSEDAQARHQVFSDVQPRVGLLDAYA
jgi:flagellar hook-length control protein FliK